MTKPPKEPKRPKRFGPIEETWKQPAGSYKPGVLNRQFAELLGYLTGYWTHVEEVMIRILHELLGGQPTGLQPPARQVFRGIPNNQGRARVMKDLLQRWPGNAQKGEFYDRIIDEFMRLNGRRNTFVHGLWYTHDEAGRTFICERTIDDLHVMEMREVELQEIQSLIDDAHTFVSEVVRHDVLLRRGQPLPGTRLPPRPPSAQ
jgi:hypothetical protein